MNIHQGIDINLLNSPFTSEHGPPISITIHRDRYMYEINDLEMFLMIAQTILHQESLFVLSFML